MTLDTVIARYQQGDTPEDIHAGFDVVPLNDVYAVIAYYLAHRGELDAYLQRRAETADQIQSEVEGSYTPEQRTRHDQLRQLT